MLRLSIGCTFVLSFLLEEYLRMYGCKRTFHQPFKFKVFLFDLVASVSVQVELK